MRFPFLVLSALFIPILSLHASIAGNYMIKGNDPLHNPYSGTATISQEADTLIIYWYYNDNTSDMGTGFVQGNYAAFVYQGDQEVTQKGVVLYQIMGNRLVGKWVPQGISVIGTETLIRR